MLKGNMFARAVSDRNEEKRKVNNTQCSRLDRPNDNRLI